KPAAKKPTVVPVKGPPAPPAVPAPAITAPPEAEAQGKPAPAPAEAKAEAKKVTSIVDLQSFRWTDAMEIADSLGNTGTATLTNLNVNVNSWYLLELKWHGQKGSEIYHLENVHPE